MMMISLLMVMIIYLIIYMFNMKMMMEQEGVSTYECGFDPRDLNRVVFSYRFFLIAILFVIFDVEVSLMLPLPYMNQCIMGSWIFVLFVLVLIVGLIYEYVNGALDWMDTGT